MMCGFLEWRGREEGKASLSLKGLGFLDGGVDEGRLVRLGLGGDFVGGLSLKEGLGRWLRLEVKVRDGRSRNPRDDTTSMVRLATCLSCGR